MISVKDFIKEYKKIVNDSRKEQFVKDHIVTEYIPYEMKRTICEKIVDVTSHVSYEFNGTKRTIYKRDSASQYMIFTLQLIKSYTDIDIIFEGDNSLIAFNDLDKENLIDAIIHAIPESEFVKFNTIMDMAKNDLYINECSNYAIADNIIQKIELFGTGFLQMLDSAQEELLKNPEFINKIKGLKK